MKASFHSHDVHAAQFAEDKFACMSFNRRYREIGYVLVSELVTVSYF